MYSKNLLCKGLAKVLGKLQFSSHSELISAFKLAEMPGSIHPLWIRALHLSSYLECVSLFFVTT